MEEKSLKERTAGGMLWGGMSNGLMQLLGAVFGLVLLRYLTPEDYGKVAMLNIFAALASALQESVGDLGVPFSGHNGHCPRAAVGYRRGVVVGEIGFLHYYNRMNVFFIIT